MKRRPLRRVGLPLAIAFGIAVPRVADADPMNPTDEERASARLLGTEGVQLTMSGDCHGAVEKLTRAEALVHAPTTAVPLAQCQIQLGKLVNGTEILNRVVNEELPPNAPPSWVAAKQRAVALLGEASPRIGRLRVHVDRPPGAPDGLQVAVDGTPLPSVLLDNDRPTDPGKHHVSARQEGFSPAEADVTLGEGQLQAVSLRLVVSPGSPSTSGPVPSVSAEAASRQTGQTPPAPPGSLEASPASSAQSANHTPAYVAFGVGAVGIAVGVVFGALALSKKSTLDSSCPKKSFCPESSSADIDALHTNAVVSNVGWGIAAAGVLAGGILFFTEHAPEGRSADRLHMRPWLGLGSAGVSGSFR